MHHPSSQRFRSKAFLLEAASICERLDAVQIDRMAKELSEVKGRVHLIGLGGSYANCVHMAADLRKLCNIDAAAPNPAELTARLNDEDPWLVFEGIPLPERDALFVLSVGGGTDEVSPGIARAVRVAKSWNNKIFGIVGPNGGVTAELGDCVIKIPVENPKHVTPHTEAFQAVIWHLLVSHPLLQKRPTKW